MMNPEYWYRLKKLYHAAMGQKSADRPAFIDFACWDDPLLRSEAKALLKSRINSARFRKNLLEHILPVETESVDVVGARIGDCRLIRLISSGGMGTVYEAHSIRTRHKLAVKVMNRTMLPESVIRGFEKEAAILKMLNHPSIIRFYGSGVFCANWIEGGKSIEKISYIVMEFIPHAIPITEYVRQKSMGTWESLKLFSHVCDAVHYGHGMGVIHQDLKPGNILVDSHGQVKVVDFGAAEFIETAVVERGGKSGAPGLIGTVQYMSPEQCRFDSEPLDIRTDLYSLGAVLYEMVCRRFPYKLHGLPVRSALDIICTQIPKRPGAHDVALAGELETIVMKALEKNRELRYRSARELARDIRHCMANLA